MISTFHPFVPQLSSSGRMRTETAESAILPLQAYKAILSHATLSRKKKRSLLATMLKKIEG